MPKSVAKPVELGLFTNQGPVAVYRDSKNVTTHRAIQITHSTGNEELATMDLSLTEAETLHNILGRMITTAKENLND